MSAVRLKKKKNKKIILMKNDSLFFLAATVYTDTHETFGETEVGN